MTAARGAAKIFVILSLVVLAVAAASSGQDAAPAEPGAPGTILTVRVEGNQALTSSAVLSSVKSRPGQSYNEEVLRDDQRRLLETHRYDSVLASRTLTDKGVIITFTVVERPLVKDVQILGVKSLKMKDIKPLVPFGAGDAIDTHQIEGARRAIEDQYKGKGFYFVSVAVDDAALREHKVVYLVTEGSKATLRKIVFEGNHSISPVRLKQHVESKTRFWPFVPGAIENETIDRDVDSVATFYRDQGYLDVRVGREIRFSSDKSKATLVFLIEEGPRFRVNKIVIDGNHIYTTDEIRRYLRLTEGQFFSGELQRLDLDKIRSLYGEIGFLDAQVAVKRLFPQGAPAATTQLAERTLTATRPSVQAFQGQPLVDLVYTIRETRQVRIGRIDIRGNRVTRQNVVRRMLQFRPEQLWDTVAIDETKDRLKETQYFEKVNISPFGDEPGVKNALVQVEEGKTGSFLIGVGVSSNVGLMGNITYTERNFDLFGNNNAEAGQPGQNHRGAGQLFSISVNPGLQQSNVSIDWQEPYLMDQPYTLGVRGFGFTAQRDEYQESRVGGQVSFGHRFKNRWFGELTTRVEDVIIGDLTNKAPRDVREVEGGNFLIGEKATLVRDNTDSQFLPSKGDKLTVSYEQVGGSAFFGRAEQDYHIYKTVKVDQLDRKHILAGRIAAGEIIGDAPVFERFYGGGTGSIRGFQYRTISPLQGEFHEEVGGNFMFFAGAEYSYPIVAQALRGVFFVDSGTVDDGFNLNNYRVSVGLGLRLQLPFFGPAPLGLDFAIPVMKADHDQTQIVNFNVGWAF